MMYKLVLFDRFVKVPNMAMSVDDVFVALGTLALVSFWTLWLPLRGRITALAILNVVLTAVVYSDLVYFRYFQDLISIPVLMQAGQVSSLGDSIGTLLSAKDIWYFIDWPFLIPVRSMSCSANATMTSSFLLLNQKGFAALLSGYHLALLFLQQGLRLSLCRLTLRRKRGQLVCSSVTGGICPFIT